MNTLYYCIQLRMHIRKEPVTEHWKIQNESYVEWSNDFNLKSEHMRFTFSKQRQQLFSIHFEL